MRETGLGIGQPAVEHEPQTGEIGLQAPHHRIAQGRHLAVVLGREPLQPRIAGMHDEDLRTAARHLADEVAHEVVGLVAAQTDAVLDGDRDADRIAHRGHAIAHQRGLGHQAGAEGAALHPLARAAAVQVDLVIAPLLAQTRAAGQIGRFAATQLQRHRMLDSIEVEVAPDVTVQQRAGGDHLGVQAGVAAEQPMKHAAVAIGPVEHRSHAEAPGIGTSVDRGSHSGGRQGRSGEGLFH